MIYTQVQDDATKNSAYLFKPLGRNVKWGDMQYDEDEQYQDDDYYSEDDYQMDCNQSVSSDGSSQYDEYDYQY